MVSYEIFLMLGITPSWLEMHWKKRGDGVVRKGVWCIAKPAKHNEVKFKFSIVSKFRQ